MNFIQQRHRLRSLLLATIIAILPVASAASAAEKGVEIIIDASGSMKAALSSGTTRLDGAKAAVAEIVSTLPADIELGFWAYGHQSDTKLKNCDDIEEIVPMAPASEAGHQGTTRVQQLEAHGYTPITTTLTRAAAGLAGSEANPHVIVLISDGKETCTGDPCAAARALANADATLVIHTIGLGVDDTTRQQLQCIAANGRGQYFDATDTGALSAALSQAIVAEAVPEEVETQALTLKRPGTLQVAAPDGGSGLDGYFVTDSQTGKEAGYLTGNDPLELPEGIYSVKFPNGDWTGVDVRAGKATTLAPAVLVVKPGFTHGIHDPETGEILTTLDWSRDSRGVLIPGRYDVDFCGGTMTMPVEAKAGVVTTLTAAAIQITGGFDGLIDLNNPEGEKVCEFSDGIAQNRPYRSVPPGHYTLNYKGSTMEIDAQPGKTVEVKLQ